MIKLAAFDVDGTLVDGDYLPESTREALRSLKDRGVALSLCTGRSEFEVTALREKLGIDWTITCNGCHIGYKGSTVMGNPFPGKLVRAWLKRAEAEGHTMLLYGAQSMFINRPNAPYFLKAREEIGFMDPLPVPAYDALPDIYQCILFCTEDEQQAYTGETDDDLYIHRWRTWAVDLNPPGMNKAVGLQKLMNRLNLTPSEVAAFGDGRNDLEMMELAGTAVVMGNAVQELKEKATFVTRSLHEDGIANAVRYLEETFTI